MAKNYDFSTAEAVCVDQVADHWEVRAKAEDGQWWTVSDSSIMDESTAMDLAEEMRRRAKVRRIEWHEILDLDGITVDQAENAILVCDAGSGEKGFNVGDFWAFGTFVSTQNYELIHAPNQKQFDAVAEALDRAAEHAGCCRCGRHGTEDDALHLHGDHTGLVCERCMASEEAS